ncbi:hypothetical protein ACW9KT_22085 [Hymenobacter sp. HD11105]
MLLLAQYPFLHLYLHQGPSQALEAQWQGFVTSAVFRQAITEALARAREHRITGWVADDRLLGAVRPADMDWIATEVMPELVRVGLRRLARIEAESPLNQLLIKQMHRTAHELAPFEHRLFTDVAQARAWACGTDPDLPGEPTNRASRA